MHLLGNANIKGALRVALLKAVHARAATHRGMDANHAAVQLRLSDQGIRKVVCVTASLQPSLTKLAHVTLHAPSTTFVGSWITTS